MTFENIIEFVKALAWPVVVFILVGLVYRKRLNALLERVQQARFPGGFEFFWPGLSEKEESDERTLAVSTESIGAKPGSLFWFASDIRWVQTLLAGFGGQKGAVISTLRKAQEHAEYLGLGTEITDRMVKLIELADAHPDPYLSRPRSHKTLSENLRSMEIAREIFAEVSAILKAVGDKAVESQVDSFERYPN